MEKLSVAGDAYCLLEVRATEAATLGIVRLEEVGNRLTAVRALLATAPADERRESIARILARGYRV